MVCAWCCILADSNSPAHVSPFTSAHAAPSTTSLCTFCLARLKGLHHDEDSVSQQGPRLHHRREGGTGIEGPYSSCDVDVGMICVYERERKGQSVLPTHHPMIPGTGSRQTYDKPLSQSCSWSTAVHSTVDAVVLSFHPGESTMRCLRVRGLTSNDLP